MSDTHPLAASLLKLCSQQFTDRSDQFFQRWQDKILKVVDRISRLPDHSHIINQCGADHLSPLTWLMKNQMPDVVFEALAKDFVRIGAHPVASKECVEVLCEPSLNIKRTLFAIRLLADLEESSQMPTLPERLPLMCYPVFFRKSFLLSENKNSVLSKWLSESHPDTGIRPLHVILRTLTQSSAATDSGLIYDGKIREDMFWERCSPLLLSQSENDGAPLWEKIEVAIENGQLDRTQCPNQDVLKYIDAHVQAREMESNVSAAPIRGSVRRI